MCYYGTTPIPKSSVFGLLNTGISVLKNGQYYRYTGFRDPGIGIPNGAQLSFEIELN